MTPAWIDSCTIDRFWRKVDRESLLGCWAWTGAYNRPGVNYKTKHRAGESRRPVFRISCAAGMVYAHRFALAITDGVPIWERQGLECCHTCGNFQCVNPAHLYWGTAEENRRDRYGR